MSIKIGLVKGIREEHEKSIEQQDLKEKYEIEDENVLIVEKPNWFKFFIRTFLQIFGTTFRLVFRIILVTLAIIGSVALVYPAPRMELWSIGSNALTEILHLIP